MWEPKYGVVSAKFVTHQAGEAAKVTNYPILSLGCSVVLFLEILYNFYDNLAILKPMV
jgi:hypothetical protein